MMNREVAALIAKDFLLEMRHKATISGILLYVFSTVFLSYYAIGQRVGSAPPMQKAAAASGSSNAAVWIALFWLIILFASVNAVAKSFVQENSQRRLYYYTLASPTAVIISKMLYSSLLLLTLSLVSYGIFSFVMGSPVAEGALFFALLGLGSVGLGIAFTFIAAIAAKSQNSATLMAILGFPVIVPILLTLVRLSRQAVHLMIDKSYMKDIFILLSIDMVLVVVVIILFPYLWRD